MTDDARDPRISVSIPPELIAAFAEPGFDPVVVELADLVTVRMDANYQVLDVSIRRGTDGDTTQQLETALAEAFNQAVREVMTRNAERLASLLERRPMGGGPSVAAP